MAQGNVIVMECDDPWFSYIQRGEKPVEGRKGTPKWAAIVPGDVIEFRCGDRSFRALVKGVNRYATLREYLTEETLTRALPGVLSIEEGERIYLQWSTPAEIARFGFLAIEVAPIM